jgi:hypothetical protein
MWLIFKHSSKSEAVFDIQVCWGYNYGGQCSDLPAGKINPYDTRRPNQHTDIRDGVFQIIGMYVHIDKNVYIYTADTCNHWCHVDTLNSRYFLHL